MDGRAFTSDDIELLARFFDVLDAWDRAADANAVTRQNDVDVNVITMASPLPADDDDQGK